MLKILNHFAVSAALPVLLLCYSALLSLCARYYLLSPAHFIHSLPLQFISSLSVSVSYLCCLGSGRSSSLRYRVLAMPV